MDLAITRGGFSWLRVHPDDVFGVRQPGRHQVHSVIDKSFDVFAIEIRKPEGQPTPRLLDANQFPPIGGTGGHAAAALGMSKLNGRRAVFLHAVELEDVILVGVADDDLP